MKQHRLAAAVALVSLVLAGCDSQTSVELKTPAQKASYGIGLNMGKSLAQEGMDDLDSKAVAQGIEDAVGKKEQKLKDDELIEASIFELIEAFHNIVARLDNKELLEIDLEKLSLTDIINDVMDRLTRERNLTFEELLGERKDRRRIVYTFLALLELIKLKMVKAYQTAAFGVIRIFPAVES